VVRKKRLTREESKARTRADLLRAANRLFLRNGFVSTSLAEIAEEAALTKGAVYSNFESKEDLFLAILQSVEDDGPDTAYVNQAQFAPPGDEWTAERLAGHQPGRRHVALFLEMNAFALRNDLTRDWVVEHNDAWFRRVGKELNDLFGTEVEDTRLLGLLAQSLWVGLMMHLAFGPEGKTPIPVEAVHMVEGLARRLDGSN
jgi:AcrR family transcriptional regulator